MSNAPVAKSRDLSMILHESKDQIEKALPKHLTPDRMLRICLTEIRKNPKLRECDPYSFMGAVIQAAQLGLEPGSGLGHAYLVPFGKQVTFIPGYKGLVDLARRSGQVKGMFAYAVFAGDEFEEGIVDGIPFLTFKPKRQGAPRNEDEILGFLATSVLANGSPQWTYMEKWEVDKIRDGLRYVSDIWKQHYVEMGKKTAIRRLCKMLPQSPELVQAQEFDDSADERGAQANHRVFIDAGVIAADYNPEPHDPEKIKAEQEAGAQDHQLPHEKEKAREALDVAIGDFMDALQAAHDLKHDPAAWLKMNPAEVVKLPIERIRAATQVIRGKIK